MKSLSSEQIIAHATRDLEFICKQILRFAKMDAKQLLAHGKKERYDLLHTIAHPSGQGSLICGAQAGERFYKLANLATELESSLRERVNPENVRKAVIDAFVQHILKEHQEINGASTELILRDAIDKSKSSLQDIKHFLPCILFLQGGPDEFNIGPVTFTRRKTFFQQNKLIFRRSAEINTIAHIQQVEKAVAAGLSRDRAYTAKQSRQLVRGLQAQAIKRYRDYPWIAQITILQCDYKLSAQLAIKAAEAALNVIRVIIGSYHTERIRLAWSKGDAARTAHILVDSDEVIHVSISSRANVPTGTVNWFEILTQDANYLERIGTALNSLVDPIENLHLQTRFIDAINWFGDAATDKEPTASLVKYVAAIERLLFGKFGVMHTKAFATRIQLMFNIFGCDSPSGNAYQDAMKIYKARSGLLHGASSPRDAKEHKLASLAENISRLCILCSTQLYPMILRAYENPGPEKLEEVILKIQKEGIGWLVDLLRDSNQ